MTAVLFVDLHLGIWPHARLDLQLIKGLISLGCDVSILTCRKSMEWHCNVHEAYGKDFQFQVQSQTCDKCDASLGVFSSELSDIEGAQLVDTGRLGAQTKSKFELEKTKLFESRKRGQAYVAASGCEITRIASYEMYLKYKLESEDRAGNREHRFQLAFELNALKMSIIGEQLASEEKFDAVFVHSPQYSANNAVLWAFQKMGTPIYFLEGSAALNERYSNVRIWDWVANGLENPNLGFNLADEEADLPSSRIASHFRVIRNGASFSVYSPRERSQRSPLKRLGLISDRPTALLVLSSSDELLAARAIGSLREDYRALKVYESQVDWLKDTIDWFGAHPELQLVVRPHPRDFPTNREPEPASHTEKITEALKELPPNIRVDGPHKPLPLWSYFREVDVLITGWSSTALEALYNDVPVITFDGGATSFPSELSFTGNNVQSYKSNLQEFAAGRLVVTPKMRKAFLAWMNENYFSTTLALRGRFLERTRVRWPVVDQALNLFDLMFPNTYRKFDAKYVLRRSVPKDLKDFLAIRGIDISDAS